MGHSRYPRTRVVKTFPPITNRMIFSPERTLSPPVLTFSRNFRLLVSKPQLRTATATEDHIQGPQTSKESSNSKNLGKLN